MVNEDLAEAFDNKLENINTQADQVRGLVDKLHERIREEELPTENGISFLEVKHHTMLSYISNLAYLSLLKLNGKSIEGHPVISNLIEDRTVLEKMKPLEQRLKYQINKLLRSAATHSGEAEAQEAAQNNQEPMITTDDPETLVIKQDNSDKLAAAMLGKDTLANPSAFKPNPSSLAVDIREEDELAAEDGIYRAPKQVPVHYEEEGNAASKRDREERRMMDRAARSRLVRDLMTEYDDRPEMASASGNPTTVIKDIRMERLAEDRARYEEENFTRLSMDRKERRGMSSKLAGLDDEFAHLSDFAGIAALQNSIQKSGSKAAILDRMKQMKLKEKEKERDENLSMADKTQRRRRGLDKVDSDDEIEGFSYSKSAIPRNKKGKFQAGSSKGRGNSSSGGGGRGGSGRGRGRGRNNKR